MNLALVYKSKIIEVKDNIEELKAIDFECDSYEEILEKIEKDTSAPKILITKRGVGYYIAAK